MLDRSRASRPVLRVLASLFGVVVAVACASGGSDTGDDSEPGAFGGDTGVSGGGGESTAGGGGSGGGAAAGFPSSAGTSSGGKGGAGKGGTSSGGSGGKSGGATGGSSGGASGGTTGGSGGAPPAGTPCSTDADCNGESCVDIAKSGAPMRYCATICKTGTTCPTGTHCTTIDATAYCVPDADQLCATCKADADCTIQGNVCAGIGTSSGSGGTAGSGGSGGKGGTGGTSGNAAQHFCAQDCSFDGHCPSGFDCKTAPNGMGKVCYPSNGAECPCAQNRSGDTRPCSKVSNGLTCTGVETCDASMMAYTGCTASAPTKEVCNGKDDDCNGKVDDLPGASCSCDASGQNCTIVCLPGFAHYPATLPDSAGCPCMVDPGEPATGTACPTPRSGGSIQDSGGTNDVTISGTLSSDTEVDWVSVAVTDVAESGTDSYHVRIAFDSNPGNEFQLLVGRNADCTKAVVPLTTYDFCTNYSDPGSMKGSAPCGTNMGQNHCDEDNSATYVIGIQRNPMAAMKTCMMYVVHVWAAAGPCDTSSFDACGGMQLAARHFRTWRAMTVRWISLVPS